MSFKITSPHDTEYIYRDFTVFIEIEKGEDQYTVQISAETLQDVFEMTHIHRASVDRTVKANWVAIETAIRSKYEARDIIENGELWLLDQDFK